MSHLFCKADAARIPLPDQSVDLVFGSPPYLEARLYLEEGEDLGVARDTQEWVEWMLTVTEESLRVSKGAVIWIAWGPTRDRNYQPACEGLMWEWFKRHPGSGVFLDGLELPGGSGSMYRPCYWHRVGISGSGGDQWFRADVEYAMCFKRPGKLPWTNNVAMGHPPKWAPGGEMSHRLSSGARVNQWGPVGGKGGMGAKRADGSLASRERPSHKEHTKRAANGSMQTQGYDAPAIANPGCYITIEEPQSSVIKTTVGGGQMGWAGAHENEAAFPAPLAEWFIKSLCPPGGIACDVFSGSGTTASVADGLGRHGIGFDLRMSQCKLGVQRLTRPHKPIQRKKKSEPMPLFDRVPEEQEVAS